jgi:Uri superfamily endonuclease
MIDMDIKKMERNLNELIAEIKEEHAEAAATKNLDTIKEFQSSWDKIISEYRLIGNYISTFGTEEEKEVAHRMIHDLHYVRCFGKTAEEHEEEVQEAIDKDEYYDSQS